jgi:protein-disulfide isomerase
VRFAYVHFAFLGAESLWAAEASECAAEQDAFWEYHDFLYENQNGENRGAFSKENLKQFADQLGLDTDKFNQCLDSGKYTEVVEQENEVARQLGVQSTPTFVVNGAPVIGAQPFESFQQVIEAFLNDGENTR